MKDDITELENQAKEAVGRIRYLKRMRALNQLITNVKLLEKDQMPNDDNLRMNYYACIDFVAQFRAMLKPNKFQPLEKKQRRMKTI